MSYTCRLYKNSGFNSSNTPDTPALLNSLPGYIDVPALEVIQPNLGSIRVKATWKQVNDVDFCRISDGIETFYYAVDGAGIVMQATDVAELPITLDYILTYGLNNSILDGETERVHVSDDGYGLYTQDDPLLNAENPLDLTVKKAGFDNGGSYTVFIETTLNPYVTQVNLGAARFSYDLDGNATEVSVDVPLARLNEELTQYYLGTDAGKLSAAYSPGTCLYLSASTNGQGAVTINDTIMNPVATLRSLGLEQAIIRQAAIPNNFLKYTVKEKTSKAKDPKTNNAIVYLYISEMDGEKIQKTGTDLYGNTYDFDFNVCSKKYNVNNNVINYSNVTKYGMMTASGDIAEFSPADLYSPTSGQGDSPGVIVMADPHLDGRPYFRFLSINRDNSATGFWRNCVPGMQWKQVPLLYTGASGSLLTKQRFINEQAIEQIGFNYARANSIMGASEGVTNSLISALTGAKDIRSDYINMDAGYTTPFSDRYNAGNIALNIGSGTGAINNGMRGYMNYMQLTQLNAAHRKSELQELGFAISTKAPTLNFPYNSEIIRDVYGNDVYLYKYNYSQSDAKRIDKLLTMYGYRHSKALEASDFTNRQYFNYVMCNNITVTGHAKWINEGIAEQLKAGVRVWHVLPNTSYYTNNPIKGA